MENRYIHFGIVLGLIAAISAGYLEELMISQVKL